MLTHIICVPTASQPLQLANQHKISNSYHHLSHNSIFDSQVLFFPCAALSCSHYYLSIKVKNPTMLFISWPSLSTLKEIHYIPKQSGEFTFVFCWKLLPPRKGEMCLWNMTIRSNSLPLSMILGCFLSVGYISLWQY